MTIAPDTLWSKLEAAFHDSSARSYRYVDAFVYALVLVSLIILGVEPFVQGRASWWLEQIDLVVLGLFAVELTLRVATYRPRRLEVFDMSPPDRLRAHFVARLRFLLRPMQLIDLATVIAVVPALRGLRVLRLLRLLKSKRIFRYGNPFAGLTSAFEADRALFLFAFSVLGIQMVLGGISYYLAERGHPLAHLESPADGLWWALVTLTTVGYGDFTAHTIVGRFVAGVLMVGGMFTLALFAGIVGHSLLNAVLSIREEQFRMSGYVNHIVVCGYEPGSVALLDALSSELDLDRSRVVLFSDQPRPADVPAAFLWVDGDPRKENELGKVRLSDAASVIIVASRSVAPSIADAATILTAFTMRSFMQPHEEKRKRPLHIVAEILDEENVKHARASGVDEIIETRRIGFSMITHSIVFPGVGSLGGKVVAYGDQSLFTGLPAGDIEDRSFGSLARVVRESTGILVLGWRNAQGDHVNPPDDEQVPEDAELIYLATRAALPRPGAVHST